MKKLHNKMWDSETIQDIPEMLKTSYSKEARISLHLCSDIMSDTNSGFIYSIHPEATFETSATNSLELISKSFLKKGFIHASR